MSLEEREGRAAAAVLRLAYRKSAYLMKSGRDKSEGAPKNAPALNTRDSDKGAGTAAL